MLLQRLFPSTPTPAGVYTTPHASVPAPVIPTSSTSTTPVSIQSDQVRNEAPLTNQVAPPGVLACCPEYTTAPFIGRSLVADKQAVDATEYAPDAVVSLDQLGPHTMTVSAPAAINSCPNTHIGAIVPADLEHVTFRGPIDIKSIGSLEQAPILVPGPVPPASESVQVTERIGQGAIWNAFATSSPSTADIPSVLKVTCVSAYRDQADGDWEVEEVRKHIVKDILAHRILDDVPCVPRLLSVWAGVDSQGREYWATVEEDAGRPVDVDSMTDAQKQAVLDAYESIHTHGVMHCDVKTVHWGFSGPPDDLQARIIDFSHAVDLSALGATHRRTMCLSEMGDVRDALDAGCKGWTRDPYSLHPTPEPSPPRMLSPLTTISTKVVAEPAVLTSAISKLCVSSKTTTVVGFDGFEAHHKEHHDEE